MENRIAKTRMVETHHSIAVSRGGTDDVWNLEELSEYEHAYKHALDFILFPEFAPKFDFRMTGWPLLPFDLREVVLQTTSKLLRKNNPMFRKESRNKLSQTTRGVSQGPHTLEHNEKISLSMLKYQKTKQHRESLSKVAIGRRYINNGKYRCTLRPGQELPPGWEWGQGSPRNTISRCPPNEHPYAT
jgi:hypothetical protein